MCVGFVEVSRRLLRHQLTDGVVVYEILQQGTTQLALKVVVCFGVLNELVIGYLNDTVMS